MSKLKFHFAGFFMSGLWLYFILDFKLVRVSVCVCVYSFLCYLLALPFVFFPCTRVSLLLFCFVFFLSMKFLHMDTR